jgi:ELWxxDGT repeat protein
LTLAGNSLYYVTEFSESTGGSDQIWALPAVRAAAPTLVGTFICSDLTTANGKLYFVARNSNDSTRHDLWVSDGTAAGTQLLHTFDDLWDPFAQLLVNPLFKLTAVGNALYFIANTPDDSGAQYVHQLWTSDGTPGGTALVTTFPGTSVAPGGPPMIAVNGRAYASVDNPQGGSNGQGDVELWTSNGTPAGTQLVAAIPSELGSYTQMNGTLYFVTSAATGPQLWQSDGSATGTHAVADLTGYVESGADGGLLHIGDAIYYTTRNYGLSRYDLGTGQQGQVDGFAISDVDAVPSGDGEQFWPVTPFGLTAISGKVFFAAFDHKVGF